MPNEIFELALLLPSGSEWIIIGLTAALIFGPKKLPELARGIGRSLGEFRKAKTEMERELMNASTTPPDSPPKPNSSKKPIDL